MLRYLNRYRQGSTGRISVFAIRLYESSEAGWGRGCSSGASSLAAPDSRRNTSTRALVPQIPGQLIGCNRAVAGLGDEPRFS